MAEASGDLHARLTAVLGSDLDRGALLREMEALAQSRAFEKYANLWAPALYTRDAPFFETFLLHHLNDGHAETIRALLSRAEADGHEALFRGLYRKIADDNAWNNDLLALATSPLDDDDVARAVERRTMPSRLLNLKEDTALALYRRNPARFGAFVGDHVHRGQGRNRSTFAHLRDEVQRRGDDNLCWKLFRELATPDEWTTALRELLQRAVPAGAVVDELRRRHPEHTWDLDAGILADFLERYGAVVLPYIEQNADWIKRKGGSRLLSSAERLGDEALYWRIFFKAGTPAAWNEALANLAEYPMTDEELRLALRSCTPPPSQARWQTTPQVALALYRRNPGLAGPFLEGHLNHPDLALFEEAERVGDDDFLDFLTSRLLHHLSSLVYKAFPTKAQQQWMKPNANARAQLDQLGQAITARYDRLYAQSPDRYVLHAASALSRFESVEGWSFKRNVEHNPAFIYLFRQHRDAWLRSPAAVRDLLESPNIYVQTVGLTILSEGGPDAAPCVVENLIPLRALLLGDARRGTKQLALASLEYAAQASPEVAGQIVPVLEEALHFQGRRTIDERIMVSFVRLRRIHSAQRTA